MFAGRRVPKQPTDLVQRERKNKALREFVHQVHGGRALKQPADLVQRERKNKALRGFVHQVRGGGKPGICQGSCAATPEQVERFLKENNKL